MTKTSAGPRARACPICDRPAAQPSWPFCSRRCADVDLARWLGGAYAISGEPAGPEARDEMTSQAVDENDTARR
jgi:endogenous inhibitor of DNA gyrase (YacG/DUF329 family)